MRCMLLTVGFLLLEASRTLMCFVRFGRVWMKLVRVSATVVIEFPTLVVLCEQSCLLWTLGVNGGDVYDDLGFGGIMLARLRKTLSGLLTLRMVSRPWILFVLNYLTRKLVVVRTFVMRLR